MIDPDLFRALETLEAAFPDLELVDCTGSPICGCQWCTASGPILEWTATKPVELEATGEIHHFLNGSTRHGVKKPAKRRASVCWAEVIPVAAELVERQLLPIGKRRLFYLLYTRGLIPNDQSAYNQLCRRTAAERRAGRFPATVDNTRRIERPMHWSSGRDAMEWLHEAFRLDRTHAQSWQIWLCAEKRQDASDLSAWFAEMGLPVIPLGGFNSATIEEDVCHEVQQDGRPAVLVFAGDYDAHGKKILKNFVDNTNCWDKVEEVALTWDQVQHHDLTIQLREPKKTDPQYVKDWIQRHGSYVQIELQALDAVVVKQLFQEAIDNYFDYSAFAEVLEAERSERESLSA